MLNISLFVEDRGHEDVLRAVVTRVLASHAVQFKFQPVSVRGGFGTVQTELDQYVKELLHFHSILPDLIIIATDANCHGASRRRQEFRKVVELIQDRVIFAIPDPHIERWLLRDPSAFKAVLGKPCQTVQQKCDRDRYKKLLRDSVRSAGVVPIVGGLEYAEDIINHMDFDHVDNIDGFGDFLESLQTRARLWKR